MDAEWIKSPTARRILLHWGDARPAWLWSHDGSTLIWRNPTARYFHGRLKKRGLKLAPEAVPIKGQIARLIRMGAVDRSSLSRIQFLAGEKPVSTTCTCTPLRLADGEMALLLVGIDPIDAELLDAPQQFPQDRVAETLFPASADYLLIDDGQIRGGSARAIQDFAPDIEEQGLAALPEGGDGEMVHNGQSVHVTRLRASPQDATLLILERRAVASNGSQEAVSAQLPEPAPPGATEIAEPMLPMGLPPLEEKASVRSDVEEEAIPPRDSSLTSLFDRLANDAELYTNLSDEDDAFRIPDEIEVANQPEAALPATPHSEPVVAAEAEPAATSVEPVATDLIGDIIAFADDPEEADAEVPASQWIISGRGFVPLANETLAAPPAISTVDAAPDTETAEQVSRYNFEELGRILTDRVGSDNAPEIEVPIAPPPRSNTASTEGVISLNAETLVLNRLPLGILLFRDQQVLFANRALVELTGYASVEGLRAAGIAAIFPATENAQAGPVTQLLRRDGTPMAVNARLQSVSWQGRTALMLSAAPAEMRAGVEGAVRAFAEIAADAREEGLVIAHRSGTISAISGRGRLLLGSPESELVGRPLAAILDATSVEALRPFLEQPARFAETSRPSLRAKGAEPGIEVTLFAEGQAGIVAGYFGFIRKAGGPQPASTPEEELEPSMLGRLSRGIRRPLNTIIGFADLMRTGAFGTIENERYVEYARDIKTAGSEIAALVDELDDFARLKDGRYPPRPSDVDLAALLESCMLRVKGQAGVARVLVRSAISERLPRIRADRASLGQAVLNLLASAIDQTPVSGSVILSAQWQDDGGIAVHVRDGAELKIDMGERFVVFRDGIGRDGETLAPVRSSVGLALTRSLLAVNACSLSVDPTAGVGTLFSLVIPAELIVQD
ncbi:MAG: HAMP domain-containing sensor histidine kinase [Devosia sp.]